MNQPVTRRQALGLLGALALPLDRLAAAAPPSPAPGAPPVGPAAPAPPDLGNLDGLMQSLAREHAPRLSFLDARWQSLDAWKEAARPVFLRHLSYHPPAKPLTADLVRREPRDGFTLEVVNLSATSAYDIPARVLVPTKRADRVPGIVALHCHGGAYVWGHEKVLASPADSAPLLQYRDKSYGRTYAELLARRGYVVVVIDAFYFGARRLRLEQLNPANVPGEVRDHYRTALAAAPDSAEWVAATNRVCSFYEHLTAKTLIAAGVTWPGLLTWDDMRTVDYLASRPEVDPARLGCIGLSIGGLRAARLIAADPRLKAACVAGWMTEFGHQLRNHCRHTWMAFMPGLYSSLDLPDAAALHAPGALLVQQCRRDGLYPPAGMQGAVDKLAAIYAKAGMSERFRGTFYDAPHSFFPPAQDEAFAWFDRWL
jgi:dienelactone hydrolase